MTRAEFDALLDHADAVIAQQMARLEVQGGPGVTVQGDTIALDDLTAAETPAARTWQVYIWVAVTMRQIYTSSEPGQVTDNFVYEPRSLTYLDGRTTAEQDLSVTVLPNIVTAGEVDDDETYPGHPYQENVLANPPLNEASNLIKTADCTFYVRGHFEDSTVTFDSGFDAGSFTLELVYNQHVIEGEPLAVVAKQREVTVRATYNGTSASIPPFLTEDGTFGDQTSNLELLTATKI